MFAAGDFLTVEVWTGRGLVTYYLLFMISLAERMVEILGMTTRPDTGWMLQIGRNLIDGETGALRDKRYLILDRRYQIHGAISQAVARCWDAGDSIAADVAELERIR